MNARNRLYGVGTGLCIVATLSACRRGPLTGPPTLRLGHDECAACGMLVNEDRCCGALLIERDGERMHQVFDDLGCMMNYEYEHVNDGTRVVERYVRDYPSRTWVDGAIALICRADREELHTPMGSGTVAFASQSAAESVGLRWKAGPMDYRAAYRDRREWMWSEYGKPQDARAAEIP